MSFQHDVVSRFATGAGLAVLGFGVVTCGVAYRLMVRLGRLPVERRILARVRRPHDDHGDDRRPTRPDDRCRWLAHRRVRAVAASSRAGRPGRAVSARPATSAAYGVGAVTAHGPGGRGLGGVRTVVTWARQDGRAGPRWRSDRTPPARPAGFE